MRSRFIVRIAAGLALLSCAIKRPARAQVALQLNSDRVNANQAITVTIVNRRSQPVSVCVRQQWVPDGAATTPLLLQRRYGHKWGTQFNGVDVGPTLDDPITIASHKSEKFKFQTSGSGKQRFVLYYWKGDNDTVCKNPHGAKKAISPTFTVLGHELQ